MKISGLTIKRVAESAKIALRMRAGDARDADHTILEVAETVSKR
jgi:hypothetical protein